MRFIKVLFACSLMLIIPLAAVAAIAGPAENSFSQGVKSANAGKYQAALDAFLQAQAQGMKKPKLDYNLAVAYYRLGRYSEARKVFTRLAKEPGFTHVAYFNLGLIANKIGDERSAIDWFLRTYRNTSDARLKALSAKALKRLGVNAEREVASKSWGGFAAANMGYDSNVRLANEDDFRSTDKSDTSYEIMATGNYWLMGGRTGGLRIAATADIQKYQTLSDYDFSQFQLGLGHFSRLGNWNLRLTGTWNESYLGGNSYQRIYGGEVRGRRGMGRDSYLRLRYRLNSIGSTSAPADMRPEMLDGLRHQFRAGLQHNWGVQRFRAYYQLDLNDRSDRVTATGFSSYSPTRQTLRAIASLRLGARWKGRLDARYRFSGYNDATTDTRVVTAPTIREDNQLRLGVRLGRNFAKYWEMEGSYNYYDNRSNINEYIPASNFYGYGYKRHVYYLGVNRFF